MDKRLWHTGQNVQGGWWSGGWFLCRSIALGVNVSWGKYGWVVDISVPFLSIAVGYERVS
jgi:hypothetical protein